MIRRLRANDFAPVLIADRYLTTNQINSLRVLIGPVTLRLSRLSLSRVYLKVQFRTTIVVTHQHRASVSCLR